MISSHVNKYFKLIPKLIDKIDLSQIEKAISHLKKVKKTKVEFLSVLEVVLVIVLMLLMILEKFVILKVIHQQIMFQN